MKILKKSLFFLLALLLLFAVVPEAAMPVSAAAVVDSGKCGENLTWTVYSDKSLVISGTGAMNEFGDSPSPWRQNYSTVNSIVVEEGVTSLPSHAFYGLPKVTTVTLPDSLQVIPPYCFSSDTSLAEIRLPKNLLGIGEYAFAGCNGLTSFEIPDTVTGSGAVNAFGNCQNLKTLTIGKGVTGISVDGEFTLAGMDSLEAFIVSPENAHFASKDGVLYTKDMKTLLRYPSGKSGKCVIPEGVETLNSYAFYHAAKVSEIDFPSTLTELTKNNFGFFLAWNASSLEAVNVHADNPAFMSRDGVMYNKAMTNLLFCPPAKSGRVELPNGLWQIGTRAFHKCANITEVMIPESVETIGFCAFEECAQLQHIEIPAGVASWGQFAFKDCSSLEWIAFGVKNSSFYQDFDGCYNLQDVYYYGTEADWNTLKISSFDWPLTNAQKHFNAVKPGTYSITYELNGGRNDAANPSAYYNYGGELLLKPAVRDGYYFDGWFEDSSFTVSTTGSVVQRGLTEGNKTFHAKWITSMDEHVHTYIDNVCRCGAAYGITEENISWTLDANGTLTLSGNGAVYASDWNEHKKSIRKVVIEDGITVIGSYLFSDVTSLKEVVIADSVTQIDRGAFWSCSGLEKVDLGEGIRMIGNGAFFGCSSLEEIIIPKSVTFLAYGVFNVDFYGEMWAECNLKSVRFEGSAPGVDIIDIGDGSTEQRIFSYTDTPITVLIPVNDATWTEEAKASLGGNLIWETYCPNHVHEPVVTEPTCIEQGYTTYTCAACGDSYKDNYTEAKGHTPVIDAAVEATCVTTGLTEGEHCGVCAFILKEQEIVPALGHDAITHEAKAAACTEIGWDAYETCTRCDYTTYAELPALGHDTVRHDDKAVSCTEPGWNAYYTCSRCDYTTYAEIPALGHDLVDDSCTRCDYALVTIKTQPKTQYAKLGEKVKFTVKAKGDDLTYQWYYKDVDGSKYKKCSGTKATYSLELTESRSGRALYCVVTDKRGNSVTTDTVYMRQKLSITSEPKTAYAALGEKAKFTVKVEGDGLTYQWYYKDVDGSKYKKCSGTKATYSLEMTEARRDRKFYCIIKDKYGNEVKSKTVYMRAAATITTQPKTLYTQLGDKAKFTVKAVGDGLKYQWYYKDADSSKYKKASCTKDTYTITMKESSKDRKFYCVITDKYGNEVKTKTVTMKMAASIKTEPKSVKTSIGKKAKFTVKAVGDGLTYQWYYKDTDGKKYKKASCTKATYSIELTKARNGRKFYCVVTDKYGNTVKTKTVSMKKK